MQNDVKVESLLRELASAGASWRVEDYFPSGKEPLFSYFKALHQIRHSSLRPSDLIGADSPWSWMRSKTVVQDLVHWAEFKKCPSESSPLVKTKVVLVGQNGVSVLGTLRMRKATGGQGCLRPEVHQGASSFTDEAWNNSLKNVRNFSVSNGWWSLDSQEDVIWSIDLSAKNGLSLRGASASAAFAICLGKLFGRDQIWEDLKLENKLISAEFDGEELKAVGWELAKLSSAINCAHYPIVPIVAFSEKQWDRLSGEIHLEKPTGGNSISVFKTGSYRMPLLFAKDLIHLARELVQFDTNQARVQLNFGALPESDEQYIKRPELCEAFAQALEKRDTRLVVLEAGHGMGKSAFLAERHRTEDVSDTSRPPAAWYFVDKANSLTVASVCEGLTEQLRFNWGYLCVKKNNLYDALLTINQKLAEQGNGFKQLLHVDDADRVTDPENWVRFTRTLANLDHVVFIMTVSSSRIFSGLVPKNTVRLDLVRGTQIASWWESLSQPAGSTLGYRKALMAYCRKCKDSDDFAISEEDIARLNQGPLVSFKAIREEAESSLKDHRRRLSSRKLLARVLGAAALVCLSILLWRADVNWTQTKPILSDIQTARSIIHSGWTQAGLFGDFFEVGLEHAVKDAIQTGEHDAIYGSQFLPRDLQDRLNRSAVQLDTLGFIRPLSRHNSALWCFFASGDLNEASEVLNRMQADAGTDLDLLSHCKVVQLELLAARADWQEVSEQANRLLAELVLPNQNDLHYRAEALYTWANFHLAERSVSSTQAKIKYEEIFGLEQPQTIRSEASDLGVPTPINMEGLNFPMVAETHEIQKINFELLQRQGWFTAKNVYPSSELFATDWDVNWLRDGTVATKAWPEEFDRRVVCLNPRLLRTSDSRNLAITWVENEFKDQLLISDQVNRTSPETIDRQRCLIRFAANLAQARKNEARSGHPEINDEATAQFLVKVLKAAGQGHLGTDDPVCVAQLLRLVVNAQEAANIGQYLVIPDDDCIDQNTELLLSVVARHKDVWDSGASLPDLITLAKLQSSAVLRREGTEMLAASEAALATWNRAFQHLSDEATQKPSTTDDYLVVLARAESEKFMAKLRKEYGVITSSTPSGTHAKVEQDIIWSMPPQALLARSDITYAYLENLGFLSKCCSSHASRTERAIEKLQQAYDNLPNSVKQDEIGWSLAVWRAQAHQSRGQWQSVAEILRPVIHFEAYLEEEGSGMGSEEVPKKGPPAVLLSGANLLISAFMQLGDMAGKKRAEVLAGQVCEFLEQGRLRCLEKSHWGLILEIVKKHAVLLVENGEFQSAVDCLELAMTIGPDRGEIVRLPKATLQANLGAILLLKSRAETDPVSRRLSLQQALTGLNECLGLLNKSSEVASAQDPARLEMKTEAENCLAEVKKELARLEGNTRDRQIPRER